MRPGRSASPKGTTLEPQIRLLIVDDDKASRDVLVGLLEAPERRIQTADDGLAAKALLEKEPFDLVLTDLNMPGLDGLELLRLIKARSPRTLVVIITGYATLENTLAAIEQGAYDYITKPFKLAEMEVLVRNACEKILLARERDALKERIREAQERMAGLTHRVRTLEQRIRRLEEREESLFLENFDLRPPRTPQAVSRRYGLEPRGPVQRGLLLARLREMRARGQITDEEFDRYARRLTGAGGAATPP